MVMGCSAAGHRSQMQVSTMALDLLLDSFPEAPAPSIAGSLKH